MPVTQINVISDKLTFHVKILKQNFEHDSSIILGKWKVYLLQQGISIYLQYETYNLLSNYSTFD